MKFFYWSVDDDPRKDPTMSISLEATGLLYRLRRQAAIKNLEDGLLTFDGLGDNEESVALLMRIPLGKFRELIGELEIARELGRKNGCFLLIKWEEEQRKYFDHLERVKANARKKRLRDKITKGNTKRITKHISKRST